MNSHVIGRFESPAIPVGIISILLVIVRGPS